MSSITIRNLDSAIKEHLRIRAAQHGHSMKAKVWRILQVAFPAVERPAERNLYDRIRARFASLDSVDDLELPLRTPGREPPQFD